MFDIKPIILRLWLKVMIASYARPISHRMPVPAHNLISWLFKRGLSDRAAGEEQNLAYINAQSASAVDLEDTTSD